MQQAFPDMSGFSLTNVKYMKRWYLFYNERDAKSQQVADHLGTEKKSQQPADQLEMPGIFGQVPWFHHVIMISKVVVRALGDITEDGVKSIKLLYICCKTARIGCTSAKHASKLDAFAFGLHYLCTAI